MTPETTSARVPARRYLLAGLALGALTALWIVPATRWLLQEQVAVALFPRSSPPLNVLGIREYESPASVQQNERQIHAYAAAHPNDLPLQMACAVGDWQAEQTQSPSTPIPGSDRLRPLIARFPDSPSLRANILRYDSQYPMALPRRDWEQINGESPRNSAVRDPGPERVAAYDADAAEGERLDPANAYFPLMRAAGLFAARRDAEALAALHRAADKSKWEEYYQDEVEGRWRLLAEACGDRSAITRMLYAAALIFPQYALMRQTARVAVSQAIRAEQQGRLEDGLRIRHDIMRVGGLMRAESHSLIGSLVGSAICQLAATRPGGAPEARRKLDSADYQEAQRALRRERRTAYVAFLERIGHLEEADYARREFDAQEKSRLVRPEGVDGFDQSLRIIVWWVMAALLLSNAFWLFCLGGAAALLSRNRAIRSGRPLDKPVRQGAGAALLLGAAGLVAALTLQDFHGSVLLPAALLAGSACLVTLAGRRWGLYAALAVLAVLAVPAALLRWDWLGGAVLNGLLAAAWLPVGRAVWPDFRRAVGAYALALGILVLLTVLFLRQTRGLLALAQVYGGLTLLGPAGSQPHYEGLVLGLALVLPLLMLLLLAAISLACRVPLSVGLTRGLRAAAAPMGCLLLLAYAGFVPFITHREAQASYALQRMLQHEGRLIAESLGREWPGVVR